jgi:hypothetical protein
MIKKLLSLGLCAMVCASSAIAQGKYTVQGEAKADFTGEIYIMDNFGRKVVDTTTVAGGKFEFKGNVETPLFAMINSRDAGLQCAFILEPGNITLAQGTAKGTPMNDDLSKLLADMQTVTSRDQYKPLIEALMSKHNNDVLGLIAVTQLGSALDAKDLKAIVEKCGPVITENSTVKASKAGDYDLTCAVLANKVYAPGTQGSVDGYYHHMVVAVNQDNFLNVNNTTKFALAVD